jgi:hypothetical protein
VGAARSDGGNFHRLAQIGESLEHALSAELGALLTARGWRVTTAEIVHR